MDFELYGLYDYKVPKWASHLKNSPRHFVKLSNLNTPIHRWNLTDLPNGFEAFIKRDDLTGTELSGSKVRSLQFLFGEALQEDAKHVVTGGGPQSGHCRSVSLICRSLGLKPHIVVEGVDKRDDISSQGNALLSRMAGSRMYLAPQENYECFKRRVRKMKQYISDEYGEKCYHIPVGGTSVKGVYGYISLFEELQNQGLHDRFDDIVVTIATGGTSLGLAIANYLTGSKLGIHAVTIGLTKGELHENMDMLLDELGLDALKSVDIVDIIEGYIGEKYGTCTEQVLRFITKVSSTTGTLLDPYYTGKGAMGMVTEMAINPSRFKGKRILFIHTGGIFGLFNGEMDRIVDNDGEVTSDITPWPNEDISPLSNLNTPLHRWNLTDLPDGFEVFIKRDDLTGSELSGSKVRSLQFIFGDALNKGTKHIIASGEIQSCLCRMVSVICRLLEVTPHLIIDGHEKKDVLGPKGNALLSRMACSKIYVVPLDNLKSRNRRLETLNQYISDKYGEKCYHIPRGGASVKGVNGFISLFEELLSQKLHERFDDIVLTLGSGGTSLGLAVANYLTGSKLRIHAVTIAYSKKELCDVMDSLLTEMGLEDVKSEDLIDVIEGYKGEAYGTCTEQVLRFITKVSSTTGILLDPYYTGKGAMGMVAEMAINPSRFKGTRILFIHTGGIFGLFNGEMDRIVDKDGEVTADITPWLNEDISPVNL